MGGGVLALDLARQGARVIGTATSEAGAERITSALADQPVAGTGVVLEVRDAAGALVFVTDTRHAILTNGAPASAEIVLKSAR